MEKKELTYSIYYTPSKNPMAHNDLNYVCSDNRIHIRFRDFNKEQIIGGFEKKLTYLVTYLMNYSYLPSIIGKYDTKTLIKNFLKTDDIQHVISAIAVYNGLHKFKGLKLTANYRKKECLPFGDVDKDCFPLNSQDGIIAVGSLKEFLEKLRIDLIEYLFNDSYFIILRENKEKAINNKFINKQAKKLERTRDPNLELVELW
jgi:hypothetical protein